MLQYEIAFNKSISWCDDANEWQYFLHSDLQNIILYIYCPVWRDAWWFVQPRKFMSPEGNMNFLGWTNFQTNWAINFLLYRKPKHEWPCDTTSGGRHEDLSSLHVTSLNQSYFFIYRINFMRYNTNHWILFSLYRHAPCDPPPPPRHRPLLLH